MTPAKRIREGVALAWALLRASIPSARKVCCGGHGLAVGCPDCGKRWAS